MNVKTFPRSLRGFSLFGYLERSIKDGRMKSRSMKLATTQSATDRKGPGGKTSISTVTDRTRPLYHKTISIV